VVYVTHLILNPPKSEIMVAYQIINKCIQNRQWLLIRIQSFVLDQWMLFNTLGYLFFTKLMGVSQPF